MNLDAALVAWTQLLGHEHVLDPEQSHQMYGADTAGNERRISATLQIADRGEIPEVLRIAHAHRVPVYPISTGHNWGYGTALPARDGCVIVDLGRLQGILHFDAEFGVVTVEPGVTQGMLAKFLEAGNHPFLVPVTGAGPSCSLLANALERGYGVTPITDHFSAVTDIEAVLPDGSLYHTALREAGGEDLARLFKWGVGPYSVGLFTQSGFGIVTKMSIVLARRPECVKVCLFSLKNDALLETAMARLRQILGKLPGTVGAINLMNQHRVLSMSAPYPKERLGGDGLIPQAVIEELGRQYQILPWTGFGTLYGTNRVVAAAQKEIRSALSGVASRLIFLTPGSAQNLASLAGRLPGSLGRRLGSTAETLALSLQLVAGRPNETALPLAYWRNPNPPKNSARDPARDGCGLIWYAPLVPMRAEAVRGYVNMVKEVTRRHGIEPLITFTTLSDKLVDSTVPIVFERDDAGKVAAATACYHDLVKTGRPLGYFPYRVGIAGMATLVGLQDKATTFHARLRESLDPHDILAPGRYR
ncbi:FAD-binding oxidoreductase [Pseudorhodoferax sp. Leaf267]|uniref:FAD-binding oxidoreductase n=1 Tax=Pseudorhodoferax sp. Leaf267 TaxID=1736316 RepID=UPI0006F6C042|nr:FAD-binding oxidoreductase [Pseudorhodoferax sp. Leaf267]KQP23163.1 FAD-linked oxidase [Pseudorhodoferax sp. Leaf267]